MASKLKVFVTRNVPQKAVEMLKEKVQVTQWAKDDAIPRDVLKKSVEDVDGLFCLLTEKIDADLLDSAKNLKVVGTMSVGYDHVDVAECRKRNIQLGFTPNVLTEATAELAMSLLLCTSRRLIEANRQVHEGGWGTWGPLWMCGQGLMNSTVGIVGMGRIGLSFAEKVHAFHPSRLLFYDAYEKTPAAETAKSKFGAEYVPFDELLKQSDFISIHSSLTEQTKHMFNKEAFDKMKSNAILVNTSRGPLVEQESLYDALKSNKIGAAGLDVCYPEPLPTDHKLLTLPNFIMLPHIGSATNETREAMATLTSANILAALEGRPLKAPIP